MKLTPQEEIEAVDIYLNLHHRGKTLDQLPEKTIAGLLNRVSPEARSIMRANQQVVENFRESGGRELPFQPKRSLDDLNVPAHTRAVLDKHDTEDVTHALQSRMGTAEPDTSPADRREMLAAAFDQHEGSTDAD